MTCDLHLRFLLDFIGAYRFRIYTTLGSYGVSQANTAAGSTRQFQDLHLGFTGKYRCRIYNAVSRSTLQVSQGLAGIIRGLESTLQIAKSFTSIYRIELAESKKGKKKRAATEKFKLNSRRRTKTREHAAAGMRTRTRRISRMRKRERRRRRKRSRRRRSSTIG
jgi:hypothetical protein